MTVGRPAGFTPVKPTSGSKITETLCLTLVYQRFYMFQFQNGAFVVPAGRHVGRSDTGSSVSTSLESVKPTTGKIII